MSSLPLSLAVKFIVAGSLVSLATWFAVQGRTALAALVGVIPFITILTVIFTYLETRRLDQLEVLALHFGCMLLATSLFPIGLYYCLRLGYGLLPSLCLPICAMLIVQFGLLSYFGRETPTISREVDSSNKVVFSKEMGNST